MSWDLVLYIAYMLLFSSHDESRDLNLSVKNLFVNSMHNNDWKKAKSTVICLDITDENKCWSRIVIRNCQERDEHSEQVLYRIMTDLSKEDGVLEYLKTCDFDLYMNWSPCGSADRNCVDCLLEVLFLSGNESGVFFVSLYTKVNDILFTLRELKYLSEYVLLRYMRNKHFKDLGIATCTDICDKIEMNKNYTLDKLQASKETLEEAKTILKKF